jgi:glutaminyl-peptide cyclotransferase
MPSSPFCRVGLPVTVVAGVMGAAMMPFMAAAAEPDGSAGPAGFSGARAFTHLESLCALGPRFSGSPGMTRQRDLLVAHFQAAGGTVTRQGFQIRDRATGKPVVMENLIVVWHPDRTERILLAAHYDTRPHPDRDPVDPRGTFLGANDGASGVAVLMELAAAVRHLPGPVGVDFVLFDAEEYVFGPRDPYFLGSTFFARQYAAAQAAGRAPHRYRAGVLIDMVGDRDLQIHQEGHSVEWPDTRPLVDSIWATAARLGVREFVPRPKHRVEDDHVPLRMIAGIPTCDIIDFDYPHWHTTTDTPANCAAESLEVVGRVLLAWLTEQR